MNHQLSCTDKRSHTKSPLRQYIDYNIHVANQTDCATMPMAPTQPSSFMPIPSFLPSCPEEINKMCGREIDEALRHRNLMLSYHGKGETCSEDNNESSTSNDKGKERRKTTGREVGTDIFFNATVQAIRHFIYLSSLHHDRSSDKGRVMRCRTASLG